MPKKGMPKLPKVPKVQSSLNSLSAKLKADLQRS